MPDSRLRPCIYTVVYGPDRDLAARTLWSYRQQHATASIVAVVTDGATPALRRAAARYRIDLLEVPEEQLSVSIYQDPYVHVVLGRFVDVPSLLPPAEPYLMVDADTLCLRPLPLEALHREMAESGATFAAAPELDWERARRYLPRCRQLLDAFCVPQVAIDPSRIMVNAGVVAWRDVAGLAAFQEEYSACLRHIAEVPILVHALPAVDQVILNALAQRHAGGRFHQLDPAWNERRAFRQHRTLSEWPVTREHGDTILWHCRDSLDGLYAECYPDQAARAEFPEAERTPVSDPGPR
jgi:hypothetical protein